LEKQLKFYDDGIGCLEQTRVEIEQVQAENKAHVKFKEEIVPKLELSLDTQEQQRLYILKLEQDLSDMTLLQQRTKQEFEAFKKKAISDYE
jgi:hypothetical protein